MEDTKLAKRLVLVGELNPYGIDPRYALYCLPENSAGGRLQRKFLAVNRVMYLRQFVRYNLCVEKWSLPAARKEAAKILSEHQDDIIVAFGRKVATAFGFEDAPLFSIHGNVIVSAHPSGLCREWDKPESVQSFRDIIRSVMPDIPIGELD